MKMEQTERSETSAYKIQTPGNYPKESIKYISPVYKNEKKKYAVLSSCKNFNRIDTVES